MVKDFDSVVAARLQSDGQRYTGNRREIVELLATGTGPVTIPEIIRARPDLAQSSVYRNLSILENAGVVHRIVTNDEWARYELAEEFTEHHHHLICSNCGSVQDFTVSPVLEHQIDSALDQIAASAGFTLSHHNLDLIGRCGTCR
jgi:Fur family transcriptional regulator, ferric uptake regulator